MVEINWTPQAIYDIESIAEFIARDSEKYAVIQTSKFFEAVEILIKHPKAGRSVPELSDDLIREIIIGNYRIVYKIVNDELVDILTIHHSKRLLSNNPAFEL